MDGVAKWELSVGMEFIVICIWIEFCGSRWEEQ